MVSQKLWKLLQPLLPVVPRSRKGGHPRLDDRAALNGILLVLTTGIPWEDLPQEPGFGSGMTCWRHLRDWQAQGVWDRLHLVLLTKLRQCDQIDWSRASIDEASVASPPPGGARKPGPNPTDRGKSDSKRHIIVDRRSVPLALSVTGADRHDSMAFEAFVDVIPAIPDLLGRPWTRPYKLHADKGHDFHRCREHLKRRGILARIARRDVEGSEKLRRHRWGVERTHAWLAGFGKLRMRFERRLDTHYALLKLACAVICLRFIERFC
ncbi:IS5 family transposase [Laribacter hongkongensis]|uniref:IS5 family transposase n=1 Tax=Laribacter hongkongensis TaxID=168471 RepID=UPI001EFDB371|nr:IS5 family transposase [Laribacter hongkongensis]MCG8996165.1 IS5 family transposase [Laribacter hongkongensis]MCG9011082.1 IS5 family transposase [Laribacter hongkongensis]MCG9023209.1 IS5 family transposase [Laribacter hongkongensis]MCG9048191.1 IS5 family transposase [Laribacter hongkongensis]MCG9074439.1 IS5 family transposase [Laribacter hongkongensis]